MAAAAGAPEDRLAVPAGGHAGGEERLDLGGESRASVVEGVEERLDPEAVARREEDLVRFVPEEQRELAAQLRQARRAQVLVEVQGDLAVGARPEPVPAALELPLDPLEVVELAVDDDVEPAVLALRSAGRRSSGR